MTVHRAAAVRAVGSRPQGIACAQFVIIVEEDVRRAIEMQARLGIADQVIGVERGSPAETAGLRGARVVDGGDLLASDIILGLGGSVVKDRESLLDALEGHNIGDRVTLRFLRGDTERQVEITLE